MGLIQAKWLADVKQKTARGNVKQSDGMLIQNVRKVSIFLIAALFVDPMLSIVLLLASAMALTLPVPKKSSLGRRQI